MTVPVQTPYNAYTYAGSSTFVYSFQIILATDLQVSVDSVVQPASNYVVSGVGVQTGGSILYTGPLTTGQRVELQRVTVLQRSTDYQNEGDFLAPTVNADYDRIWMALQEQQSGQIRALRVPETPGVPTLPPAAQRANNLLSFDSSGNPIVVAPAAGSATALAANLANTTDPTKAAGQIGWSALLTYASGTLGGLFNGFGMAQSFGANLILLGTGSVPAPGVGETRHIFELVNTNTNNPCFQMSAYGALTNGNNMHFSRYNGTQGSATPVTIGQYFMSCGYRGWDGSGAISDSQAAYQVLAAENWDSTHHGLKFHWDVAKSGGALGRSQALELYAGPTDGAVALLGDGTNLTTSLLSAGNTGAFLVGSADGNGASAVLFPSAHATLAQEAQYRGVRTRWQTIAGTELVRLTATGLAIGKGADASYALEVKGFGANVFNLTGSSNNAMVYATSGGSTFVTGENAAACALFFRKENSTNRSINAAGTINASGADYAEYMLKADGCGAVAKGAVVGIDADGNLTDQWARAISFVVKSTNPSYVGGDTWGHAEALGAEHPVEPVYKPADYTGVDAPATLIPDLAEDEEAVARYEAARAAFEADWGAHVAADAAARAKFEAEDMATYRTALASFEAVHEAARQTVDRIAFSGQVPVNVLGAKPGDYIVPVQAGDGIAGIAVTAPSFEQYMAAVGRVIAIESDGRARIIVKVA